MKAKRIKFINKNKTVFFDTLKSRVDNYFKENNISQYANGKMVFKSFVMLCIYFVPYALIMTQDMSLTSMWICTLIMGLGLAGLGMCIMHDANHNAYSSNRTINKIMGHSLNVVGGEAGNWITQHNLLHHTYTNIFNMDKDIDDKGIMRLTPDSEYKKIQRFQTIYVFFFYSIMTLYWTTLKDFAQFYQFIRDGYHKEKGFDKFKTFFNILIWKLFYWGYIIVLPVIVLDVTIFQVFIGFLSMHLVGGLILSITFQLAHVVEKADFPKPDPKGNIYNEWAIHQLNTTADFARDNWLISYYFGGLNFQAIHHLFPQVCHVHYPKIAPIVEQTAKEFGVKYLYHDTMREAFASHMRLLSKLGKDEVTFSNFADTAG